MTDTPRKTKTLFIGLDGCTYTVLDQMTRDLPGLCMLRRCPGAATPGDKPNTSK